LLAVRTCANIGAAQHLGLIERRRKWQKKWPCFPPASDRPNVVSLLQILADQSFESRTPVLACLRQETVLSNDLTARPNGDADKQNVARVVAQHRGAYVVVASTHDQETWTELSSRFYEDSVTAGDLPSVGDLVVLESVEDRVFITSIRPRKSMISRNAAGGRTDEQVLAANVDVAIVAVAANLDRFAARVERYLVAAWDSGATPIVVITKIDLASDPAAIVEEIETVAVGVRILLTSSLLDQGITELKQELQPDRIGVLLGPSGVGKSSLVNALIGQAAREVRATRTHDRRGRHTTTVRALIELPTGGAIIDTPGLREFKLWDESGVDAAFEDIARLEASCKFSDCHHDTEPGCAIKTSLLDGSLDQDRYGRYLKLRREARAQVLKRNRRAQLEARRKKLARLRAHDG
jgi:ribosome biogenesis GTPase / thiamine phosphate phosphatase